MEVLTKNQIGPETEPTGYFLSRIGKIAYWIEGKGNSILLLHSAGHDHRDFDSILPKLRENYRVISIDWPGHGMSPIPDLISSASAVTYAEILPDLVKELAPEGVILIGNSIGGYASMRLALDNPSLVRGLVLVDTGGMNDPDWKAKTFSNLKGKVWFTGLIWNFFPEHYIKIRNQYTESILNRIKKREIVEGAKEVNASIWKSFLDERHDLREKVAGIHAPTLIVWGKFDPVIAPELANRLHKKIGGSRLALLRTGHVPFAEDPDSFLKVTLPFIKSVF